MIDIPINGSSIERIRSYRFRTRGGHSIIERMTMFMNDTDMEAPLVDRTFKGAAVKPSA